MTSVTALLLSSHGVEYEVDYFHAAEKLLEVYNRGEIWDLILMDIMMDGCDGLQVAEALRAREDWTDLIFVTNSPEYALVGYRSYPVNYLLKLLTPAKLEPVLLRCLERHQKLPALVLNAIEGGKVTLPLEVPASKRRDDSYCPA